MRIYNKIFYRTNMEKELNQQEQLAKNLVYYRKEAGLTQLELAEQFNYSDKSVSKWERGEGFPDVFVLKSLADFYGITVDDLYSPERKKIVSQNHSMSKQIFIKLLSVLTGWTAIICVFFFLNIFLKDTAFKPWLLFIYGALVSGILLLIWDFIYRHRFLRMIDTSIILWVGALSIFLTLINVTKVNPVNMATIFIVAIPLEVLEIVWFLYRTNRKKAGRQ